MIHLFADPEFWVLLAVVVFAAIVWKPVRRVVETVCVHAICRLKPIPMSGKPSSVPPITL